MIHGTGPWVPGGAYRFQAFPHVQMHRHVQALVTCCCALVPCRDEIMRSNHVCLSQAKPSVMGA